MTKISRRQMLRGVGGFALALPFLPSLLPKHAKAAPGDQPKRFIAMATSHGGITLQNMYPDSSTLTQSQMYAGHIIQAGALTRTVASGRASLSPVLSAPSSDLTDGLINKMNVIHGMDIPFYIAHHTGGHLGNFARNNGDGGDGRAVHPYPRATIDQIMAWSKKFYPDGDGFLERTMVLGDRRLSYTYSNPATQTGDIVELSPTRSSLSLFQRIFKLPDEPESMRTPVVDRVLENYNRLRQSNQRLSAADRIRLDDHIQRIDELQRKLNTNIISCGDVQMPSQDSRTVLRKQGYYYSPEDNTRYWQLMNEVVAVAMICGTSRIATMHCEDNFSTFQGDWHHDIAHLSNNDAHAQRVISSAHQRFFEGVFVDLIKRLDVDDGHGSTILDNSLVMWTQESGAVTHATYSVPIVTAGSAGGFFNTGNYYDFRNHSKPLSPGDRLLPGLIYNQWLGNILQSMGLAPSDYERDHVGGYGHLYIGKHDWYQRSNAYPSSVVHAMSQKLPLLTA